MSLFESRPTSPSLSMSRDFERVLFVHAHPDDETITTGATLATLVDSGAHVTVVTCTRGELGEVIPEDLAALRDAPAALAVHREGEIAAAMRELGVIDHRFLGAQDARTAGLPPRPYRDSGMEWGADGTPVPVAGLDPASFCAAEFGEIVSDLTAVIASVRPDAVISYDHDGGYGHPDHVRVNRAALRAARLAGVPFFAITRSSAGEVADGARAAVAADGADAADGARAADAADVVIDGRPVLTRKLRALKAYRTQVRVVETDGVPALEFPHGAVEPVSAVETFRQVPEPVSTTAASAAPSFADYSVSGKVLTYVLAVVAGGLFGAIGTVSHQNTIGTFPLGAVLALLLVLALFIGFRAYFDSRKVGIACALGVVVVIVALTGSGSGGSALIPANPAGYAWTLGPTALAVVVLGWPRLPGRRSASSGSAGDRMATSPQSRSTLPDAKEQTRP